ncbi:MAG: amidohydrolase [Evtepia sp.]
MDTVFYNGVIHTMAGRTVSALAVQNGRIALVGTDEAALALADTHTKKIDLGGRCVLPGFTDSHIHILQAGMVCHRLDLRGVTSLQEIIDRGQDYVKHADLAPGEWIIGYGFDHNRFDPPTLPDGATAEAISSDLPVILDRVCGHIGAANRKAFELAGYDENTVIPGGELDKDEHGHLNGIIREAALDQIKRSSPRQTKEQVIARIQEIGTQLAAAGLTSVHSDDVGMEGTKWPILKEAFADMEAENRCPVRLWEEWEAPALPISSGS